MNQLLVANWKMKLTDAQVRAFLEIFIPVVHAQRESWRGLDVVLCPSFPSLPRAHHALASLSQVSVGAQDVYPEESGAYTGEVSVALIAEFASFALVGHSERRTLRGETDADISRKITACLAHALTPIVCVGESLQTYDARTSQQFIEQQLVATLEGVSLQDDQKIVIAYEPIWALSSTKDRRDVTISYVRDMVAHIRQILSRRYNEERSAKTRILYGGNVTRDNAHELLTETHANGALIGSASCDPGHFTDIIAQRA